MKVGSLVARLPNRPINFRDEKTGEPSKPALEVPVGEPVIVKDWKYASKKSKDMFDFLIEGYDYADDLFGRGVLLFWYPASIFVELQPPMDLSFIEEMQMSETNVLVLK